MSSMVMTLEVVAEGLTRFSNDDKATEVRLRTSTAAHPCRESRRGACNYNDINNLSLGSLYAALRKIDELGTDGLDK
ncbi:hypothetical protein NECAME_07735 [Necator americanus]|uniref:Uncharacterized protein n=1 Tax=Necator americanus TaxID=51031 RepID=W2TNY9_NECAM|nr:hypothetical protein NECAME_07735 [Necator americanus]ETN82841.1 hypothetical protein NECAME_07735 [Necator americanus]